MRARILAGLAACAFALSSAGVGVGVAAGVAAGALATPGTASQAASGAADAPVAPQPVCRSFPRPGTSDDLAVRSPTDGAVWYGDRRGNRIVRLTGPGAATPFVPGNGATSGLSGLAFGPDGRLWYTKDSSDRLGTLAPGTGGAREFAGLEGNSFPAGILADRSGRLWFHSRVRNYVGLVRANGTVVVHRGPVALSTGFAPQASTLGADGNLWLTDRGHNAIYRFDVESRRFTRFDIPTPRAEPGAITTGSDGNVWFTMNAVARVGRISPSGEIAEIELRDLAGVALRSIAATPDGSLWVTSRGPKVARILPGAGVVTFPCGNGLGTALAGPDGAPWFFDDAKVWFVETAPPRSPER